ncbi:MAG: extracellular solute-binding protein [Candidatus Riflebacteria bacterium]|nr:extracellular solute-binding protein [Candidatus Riflebacteria bacterium]
MITSYILKQTRVPDKTETIENSVFSHSEKNTALILYNLFLIVAALSFFPVASFAKPVSAGKTEINIWDYPRWLEPGEATDRFAWIRRQIKAFESENPDITVKLTELSWSRGDEKLKIAALGGLYPDIAPGTVPLLFIKEGLIEPIDTFLTEDDRRDILPGALDAFTVKGRIYGWPWYMGGQLLFVNRGMAASAGITLPADGRWTPEVFVETLERFRNYLKAFPEHYPLSLYFQKNETANFPFAFLYGGDWIRRDMSYAGDSPETIAGLEWMKSLVAKGLMPSDVGGRTADSVWEAFGRENRVAIGAFGLWAVKFLREKFPMDFEIMHFPAPSGKISPAFLGISGLWVFSRPDRERVAAAMKLARFLTSSKLQRDLVRYTQFPTRRSAADIYADVPPMKRAWEVLSEGRTIVPDPRWPRFDEEIESSVQSVLLSRVGATDAMRLAGTRIQAGLARSEGSVHEDLQKGSPLGRIFLCLFPLALIFAIATRQVHLIFLLPAISIIGIFLWYPLGDALMLAFRDYRIGAIGDYTLGNFERAFSDPKFFAAMGHTLLYTLVVVPANVFTALIASSMIFGLSARAKSFFRAMYYLPGVASVVVLTMVWRWMFNGEIGLFNATLRAIGLPAVGWLTNPDVAFWSVMLTGILRSPGGAILIYLAALANVPRSLYESAELDGATPLQQWWHITIPLLRGTTMFLFITGAIDALQVFAQVLMLTDGGPGDATQVVMYRVYTSAFRDFDFGLSSAMALILFIGILVVTLLQKRFGAREELELA